MTQTSKPILETLRGNATTRTPIWLMRQAGRYLPEYRELRANAGTFLDLCYTPNLAIEATLQPIRRFDLDAAIIFSDILVIPHALGCTVEFVEGQGPVLEPLTTAQDIDGLKLDGMIERLTPVYEALHGVRAALSETVALIGFAGAPWTIASYMIEGGSSRDHMTIRRFAYENPVALSALIDTLTVAVSNHLLEQIRAGAEIVQIFDTWAGILPPDIRRKHSVQPIRAIAERIRDAAPETPVIVFPRGVGGGYGEYAELEAVTAVSIDTAVDPAWAAQMVQPAAVVQGNLDPMALVAGGPAMEQAIGDICSALSGGGHIFNLGHGVVPATPPQHVTQLIAYIRDLRK